MSTISDAWRTWTAAAQINPPPSIDDATDILQTFGPTLSDTDGDAWWNAVATEFEGLGLIRQPSYVQLRNFADGNEAGANRLFDALLLAINGLPESRPVNQAINLGNDAAARAAIAGNITRIENLKSGGTSATDIQFDTALDQAIFALQQLQQQLGQ